MKAYVPSNVESLKLKLKSSYKPLIKVVQAGTTPTPMHTEELLTQPQNFNLLNFNLFNNESLFDMVEDNYESLKSFKALYSLDYQNGLLKMLKYIPSVPYTTVLDTFRANYDEYN
jgi:hypothetical protein